MPSMRSSSCCAVPISISMRPLPGFWLRAKRPRPVWVPSCTTCWTSKAQGRKGIIKIADRFFEDEELGKLALIAPKATVNIIRDFKVVEKKKLETPAEVIGIAKCRNPKCVTNHQPIRTWFKTVVSGDEISLKCHYCEKNTDIRHAF